MISFILKMTAFVKTAKGKAKEKQLEAHKKLKRREALKDFKKGDVKTELDDLKDSKEQGMKKLEREVNANKLKAIALEVLSYVIGFFESLPIYITIFLTVLGLVVIIGVIVMIVSMIVALQSLLSTEGDKPTQIKPPSQNLENLGSGGDAEWSLEELAQRGGLLTNYEKNLYKLVVLSKNGLTGVYDGKTVIYPSGGDLDMPLKFATGIFSTENSGVIYLNGNDTKDILVTPTDATEINSSGYGSLFGIEASKNLDAYFDSTSASKVRDMFKPATSGNEIFFIPYGSAMSVKHFNEKLNYGLTLIKNNSLESEAKDVIKSFGITSGVDDVYRFSIYVFATSLYHGGNVFDFPDITAFVSALYASTSTNDAERSFDKVQYLGASNYDESTFRKAVLGSTGFKSVGAYDSPINLPKASISAYFKIGDKDVKEPLWAFLYREYSSNPNMVSAWKLAKKYANANDNTSARVLNFHYGLNSYYQGHKIMTALSGKLIGTSPDKDNGSGGNYKPTGQKETDMINYAKAIAKDGWVDYNKDSNGNLLDGKSGRTLSVKQLGPVFYHMISGTTIHEKADGSFEGSVDCSSYVQFIYKKFGVALPRTANTQFNFCNVGTKLGKTFDLQPTDLLFFSSSENADAITHVAMYIGNNEFIHAYNDNKPLGISKLKGNTYYEPKYMGARRIVIP